MCHTKLSNHHIAEHHTADHHSAHSRLGNEKYKLIIIFPMSNFSEASHIDRLVASKIPQITSHFEVAFAVDWRRIGDVDLVPKMKIRVLDPELFRSGLDPTCLSSRWCTLNLLRSGKTACFWRISLQPVRRAWTLLYQTIKNHLVV